MAQVLDRAAVREALHDELATLRVLNRMLAGKLTREEKTTAMQARSRSLCEIRRLLELLRDSDRLRLMLCQRTQHPRPLRRPDASLQGFHLWVW